MEAEEIVETVEKVLKSKERGFVESVDLCINLKGVDLKQPKSRVNVDVTLPKKFKKPQIGVFGSVTSTFTLLFGCFRSTPFKFMQRSTLSTNPRSFDFNTFSTVSTISSASIFTKQTRIK